MSMINYASREINCKLVYYGPGLGGKTTNLEHIYGKVSPNTRGKMISLATETERTLFFDFLPVDLGTIRGFKTRFHLYTVPGQVYYNASRKLILKGVDGIGPDDLHVDRLLARVSNGSEVREVIVATNPSMEGEATATYLQQVLKPIGVRVTRIARGLPVGGDLEYADAVTIAQALAARRDMSESE